MKHIDLLTMINSAGLCIILFIVADNGSLAGLLTFLSRVGGILFATYFIADCVLKAFERDDN
jgi:hypothetical protein